VKEMAGDAAVAHDADRSRVSHRYLSHDQVLQEHAGKSDNGSPFSRIGALGESYREIDSLTQLKCDAPTVTPASKRFVPLGCVSKSASGGSCP